MVCFGFDQDCSDSTQITRIYCTDWALRKLVRVSEACAGRTMVFRIPTLLDTLGVADADSNSRLERKGAAVAGSNSKLDTLGVAVAGSDSKLDTQGGSGCRAELEGSSGRAYRSVARSPGLRRLGEWVGCWMSTTTTPLSLVVYRTTQRNYFEDYKPLRRELELSIKHFCFAP